MIVFFYNSTFHEEKKYAYFSKLAKNRDCLHCVFQAAKQKGQAVKSEVQKNELRMQIYTYEVDVFQALKHILIYKKHLT